MKLKYLFTALLAAGMSFVAAAQNNIADEWEYADNYWFAGVGGGLNIGWDGQKYVSRTDPHAGAGIATDIYVGKWFNSIAGFRVGWQGLTISDIFDDFGRSKYNYFHGDVILRPVSFVNPYLHAGYVKVDKGEIGGGAGVAFPIHLSRRLSIVPDVKYIIMMYTVYDNDAYTDGKRRPGQTLSATIGLSFNLSGKKKAKYIPVPYEVVRYQDREVVVRDTVYIEKAPDCKAKTEEVNTFLRNVTLFDWDSYAIRPEAQDGLNKVVDWMTEYPNVKAKIEGHTDNTGNDEYNQKLSENRCKAILDYLVGKGIDPARLSYEGFGATRPVAENDTWA